MAARTFTVPAPGPLLFDLEAPAAGVVITVSLDTDVASCRLSGPAQVVDGASSSFVSGRWALMLPRPDAQRFAAGGVTIIAAGVATVITGGSMTFVNGRLTGGTGIRTVTAEPVHLAVALPAGSRLAARITAGRLAVRGELPEAEITGTSADVDVDTAGTLRASTVSGDITAAMVTGSAWLRTISGDVGIGGTDGPVTASTTSGDITVRTGSPVTVTAESVSGDITVRASRGAFPQVRAHSVSGAVRTATS